jgi:hypothetical protein
MKYLESDDSMLKVYYNLAKSFDLKLITPSFIDADKLVLF